MKFKKKHTSFETLYSLVIVDNQFIATKLIGILKTLDSSKKWHPIFIGNSVSISTKESGISDEYIPNIVVKSPELKKYATMSKEIYVALLNDNRGNYNAYHIKNYIKKVLKISIPLYRLMLPTIDEQTVANALCNLKKVYLNDSDKKVYDFRLAIDSLIKYYTNEIFEKSLPILPNLELHTSLLLQYINELSNFVYKYSVDNSLYGIIHTNKDEAILSNTNIKCDFKKENIGNRISLKTFYLASSNLLSWFGFKKSLLENYANGFITYPTSDTTIRLPKLYGGDKNKIGDSWCLKELKENYESLSESSSDMLGELKQLCESNNFKYLFRFNNTNNSFYDSNYSIITKANLECKTFNVGEKNKSIGCEQSSLLNYILKIKMPLSLIPYTIYSLVKQGLIVYTSDTTIELTTLGKFILYVVKKNIPILLKESFVINTNKAIEKQKENNNDDEKYYDEFSDRWDRVKIEIDSIDELEIPKVLSKCKKCGKRLDLSINNKGLFLYCSNNKCSKSGKVKPIKFKNGNICSC